MKRLLFLLAAALLVVTFASAQDYGSIYGTVTDTEGNPLPGVSVSISSAYYPERTVVTSAAGTYRFLRLPVARDYKLKCELTGFKTVIRENVIVEFGKDYRVDVSMEPAAIEESVTVVATTPIIDTKKSQVGVRVSREMLMDLPTARNPWVIMQMAPGVLVDREDVGGNEAGQQSAYYGHGSSGDDNTWLIDGANITDNSALGAAPAYVNLSSYEELVINYGVNDVTSPTGGIQLNIVSKRGGNNYSGEFYLDVAQKEWQLKNVPAELKETYVSPGVNKIYLYGVNFGGPIVRDKLWFYGSWGIQDIDSLTMVQGITDKTWLLSGYGKLNFQLFKGNRAEFFLEYDNKLKWNRTFAGVEYQAPETMWNQTGPGYIYKFEDEHVVGNLLLTAKAIYTDGGFYLTPTQLGSGRYMFESYDGYYTGNVDYYGTDRNQLNVVFSGNYFQEKFLGGDHEIKFGVDYVTATVTTFDLYEGNASIHEYYSVDDPTYYDVWLYRDYYINLKFDRISAFFQDTITFGRLALNLGFRYDREKSIVKNEHQPAAPLLTNWLREITIEKYDPGVAWKVFSPRFSLTYDLFGNGKDVIKLAVARYGSQSGFGLASWDNPAGWTEIDLLWKDLDGNGRITEDELFGIDWETGEPTSDIYNPDTWLWWSGLDPWDPTALENPRQYDPKYNSPLLDELTLSYQKELMPDFAASLEFFAKKRHRLTWDIPLKSNGDQYTLNDYTTYMVYTFPVTGETRTLVRRPSPYTQYRTNAEKAYERYLAGQIVLNKRLSNRWMMNASFTYSDWKFFYNGDYAWNNPNNMVFYEGGVVAPQSGGSGLTGIFVNSRWMVKLSGLYQLPYNINISGFFQMREGYVMPRYVRQYIPGFGTISLYSGKMGDNRLPAFWELSLRLEKVFNVGETSKVIISADAFNVTNNNVALKKQNLLTSPIYGQTVRILNPAVFRFGARFQF